VSIAVARQQGRLQPVLHLDLVAGARVSIALRHTDMRPLFEALTAALDEFEKLSVEDRD
jgi:hypothetical protein